MNIYTKHKYEKKLTYKMVDIKNIKFVLVDKYSKENVFPDLSKSKSMDLEKTTAPIIKAYFFDEKKERFFAEKKRAVANPFTDPENMAIALELLGNETMKKDLEEYEQESTEQPFSLPIFLLQQGDIQLFEFAQHKIEFKSDMLFRLNADQLRLSIIRRLLDKNDSPNFLNHFLTLDFGHLFSHYYVLPSEEEKKEVMSYLMQKYDLNYPDPKGNNSLHNAILNETTTMHNGIKKLHAHLLKIFTSYLELEKINFNSILVSVNEDNYTPEELYLEQIFITKNRPMDWDDFYVTIPSNYTRTPIGLYNDWDEDLYPNIFTFVITKSLEANLGPGKPQEFLDKYVTKYIYSDENVALENHEQLILLIKKYKEKFKEATYKALLSKLVRMAINDLNKHTPQPEAILYIEIFLKDKEMIDEYDFMFFIKEYQTFEVTTYKALLFELVTMAIIELFKKTFDPKAIDFVRNFLHDEKMIKEYEKTEKERTGNINFSLPIFLLQQGNNQLFDFAMLNGIRFQSEMLFDLNADQLRLSIIEMLLDKIDGPKFLNHFLKLDFGQRFTIENQNVLNFLMENYDLNYSDAKGNNSLHNAILNTRHDMKFNPKFLNFVIELLQLKKINLESENKDSYTPEELYLQQIFKENKNRRMDWDDFYVKIPSKYNKKPSFISDDAVYPNIFTFVIKKLLEKKNPPEFLDKYVRKYTGSEENVALNNHEQLIFLIKEYEEKFEEATYTALLSKLQLQRAANQLKRQQISPENQSKRTKYDGIPPPTHFDNLFADPFKLARKYDEPPPDKIQRE